MFLAAQFCGLFRCFFVNCGLLLFCFFVDGSLLFRFKDIILMKRVYHSSSKTICNSCFLQTCCSKIRQQRIQHRWQNSNARIQHRRQISNSNAYSRAGEQATVASSYKAATAAPTVDWMMQRQLIQNSNRSALTSPIQQQQY